MKKMFTYLMTTVAALTTVMSLASCEWAGYAMEDVADREEARTLDGTWTGYIDTYYYDRWGKRGDSYRTSLFFERENPYGGWGYEVDYNVSNRYVDYYCEFRWEVSNGSIRIRYADSSTDVIIYDYTLGDHYFSGYMDDGTSREIRFQLRYNSDFDWDGWRATWRARQATLED